MAALDHQFEPMSTGMVLDRAFDLYAHNLPLMLGITAVVNIPMFLIAMLPLLVTQLNLPPLLRVVVAFSSAIATIISAIVVYPLVTGATTKAVSDKYLGNPVTIGSALKEAWGSVGTLLLTQLVVGVMVMLGFLLLIVPGVLLMLSYSLVPAIIMIESSDRKMSRQVHTLTGEVRTTGPLLMDRGDIRRRSWELVEGNRGKVFVVFLVLFVMQLLLGSGASWFTRLFFEATSAAAIIAESIITSAINILVTPLQTIAITLLYYDFRIRKEGFDLEMLSRAMGGPTVSA